MSWTLEENGKIPVYLQIAQKLMAEIENGTLKEGERLMPERKLSENLHVARNTVKQAYEELCREGYASTKKGSGTYVDTSRRADMGASGHHTGRPAHLHFVQERYIFEECKEDPAASGQDK